MVYSILEDELKPDNGRVLGIDLGVSNFATCVTNSEFKPFILDGRYLKSYNRLYNKKKARLQSLLQKGQYNSKQLEELEFQRYCKIQDIFHLYSKRIIDFCLENNINTIAVGRNKDWKQNCNIGRRNNQNFVQIPFLRFINMLQYKCQLYGINFIETEESYTSKIDHLAKESMQHHDSYLGKRVRRGLFQSSIGKFINADVNGAIGIIRKVFGDSLVSEIADRGLLYRPVRIYWSRINEKE